MSGDDDLVPIAHSMCYGRCPDPGCVAIHIVLLNEGGRIIATAALTRQQIGELIAQADDWAEEDKPKNLQ